jgi:S-layer homology domain
MIEIAYLLTRQGPENDKWHCIYIGAIAKISAAITKSLLGLICHVFCLNLLINPFFQGENMKHKSFAVLLLVIMLIASSGSALAQGIASSARDADSQSDMLNGDGTLKLDGSYSGPINLQDWNIRVDDERGPIFSTKESELISLGMQPVAWKWSALGSNPAGNDGAINGGLVEAITVNGNDVYIGGAFTDVGGVEAADYIAKWDGTHWSALGSNGMGGGAINDSVSDILIIAGDIYIAGGFTNVNNRGSVLGAADYIAKWDGANWSALGSNGAGEGSLNGVVAGLATIGTTVYAGGSFENVNNKGTELTAADYIAKFDGANWSPIGSNGSGNGSLNGAVYDVATNGSNLYVGGVFTNVSNSGNMLGAADYIAKWDGANWSALGSNGAGNGSLNAVVYALAASGGDVYAGGWFGNVNNNGAPITQADYVAKFDGTNWSALGDSGDIGSVDGAIRGPIHAIAVSGDNVFVGGVFGNAGSAPAADAIARWDGVKWWSLGDNGSGDGSLNNEVYAITATDYAIYVGGIFVDVNDHGTILWNADSLAKYEFIPTFSDVSLSYWAIQYIERLYAAGITGGCGGGTYCPESSVTRAQMAVFLERGIHGSSYNPPAVGSSTGFGDVQLDHWAGAWIKQLATEGITGGCGTGIYCPQASVTRAQMAVFLLRSKYGTSYSPPAVGDSTGFGDVRPDYWAAAWIKQLVAEGITAGCGTGAYCPESPVTRAQMAVFLVRTFNLP